MKPKQTHVILLGALTLALLPIASRPAAAQGASQPYPAMAPIEQYLMDRNAEIALARSAAPDAISHDASVIVLTRHGYETAVAGKNGWVCMVERSWGAMFDSHEFWNPKIRAADCLNPPAARSVLPYIYIRTKLFLAGRSKQEVIAAIKSALDKNELPSLEQGAICYMMSKSSYLSDKGAHDVAHMMFFQTDKADAAWGANLKDAPVASVNYWYSSARSYPQLRSFPPMAVFLVTVDKWSDGTPVRPK